MTRNTVATLERLAKNIADQMVRRSKGYAPTERIRANIFSRRERTRDTVSIRVGVNLTAAPEARAYEYGSGMRARRSRTSPNQPAPFGPIVIRPVNKRHLTFFWEAVGGVVSFNKVNHPGVEAKPDPDEGYLAKARREVKNERRSELSKSLSRAVLSDIHEAWAKK